MTPDQSTRSSQLLHGIYLVCALTFLALIAYNHFRIISHDLPLDYQETGMLAITETIAGSNPFALENQPAGISLYPVLYNLIIAPATHVLDNTLELHRLVAAVFILGSCALCFILCRLASGTRTDSLVAAILLYAVLLYYSTPIASPNSLGLFLFLSALTIPWLDRFSTRSLAASIALGVLAFYTKQYFVAALGYVALYLFLAESKKRALVYGIAGTSILALSLVLVVQTSPYYLENTIFAVRSSAELAADESKVVHQFREYAGIYYPLLLVLVVAAIYKFPGVLAAWRANRKNGVAPPRAVDLLNPDAPLLAARPAFIWLCLLCSLAIILLVLGSNSGNHLSYLFQLISPFLLAGTLGLLPAVPGWQWPFRAMVLLALYNSYTLLPTDFSVDKTNWRKIQAEIATADDMFASTLVLHEVIKTGSQVYFNGHSHYFLWGAIKPPVLIKSNPEHRMHPIWERHVKLIESKLKNREFDLVVLDNWLQLPPSTLESGADPQAALDRYYEKVAEYNLPLPQRPGGGPYRVRVYKPAITTSQ